jgi:hypothetical protein
MQLEHIVFKKWSKDNALKLSIQMHMSIWKLHSTWCTAALS